MLIASPKTLLFILSLWYAATASAQSLDYGFKHLTTDNGLTHDQVQSIVKDKQGFMWFGTLNGLNRFDGFQFKGFKHSKQDSTSIPHNTIVDLVCDTSGYLWMSTADGICRYDPFKQNFRRIALPGNQSSPTWHLAIDHYGDIIVSHGGNLFRINSGDLRVSVLKNMGPVFAETKIFNGGKDRLWLINHSALYRFDYSSNQQTHLMGYDDQHRNEQIAVMHVYTDPRRTVWIATYDQGLYNYDESKGRCELITKNTHFMVSLGADISYSENNLLWIGGGFQD